MGMEMLQIKYFMAVARSENISRAAQEFMVPPSSVSVAIKKLEADWGYPLFDRTANRLKLNTNGKLFLHALEIAEREMRNAKMQMQNLAGTVSGEIRLLILSNRRNVMQCISSFKAAYPHVAFTIRHEWHQNYMDYDLIVTDRILSEEVFERRLYQHEEMLLAVPKNHPLALCESVSLSALGREKFICMPKGSSLGDYTHAAFSRFGISPEIAIECDDPEYILMYLKMGLGLSLFPNRSWGSQVDENIHLIKLEGNLERDSYVYLRKNASVAAKQFAKTLAEA